VHNSYVRSYVGVTDGEWYRYLAARPELREVNFWRPSGSRRFGALSVGEPFFFKTHYPDNRVVGGGFYSDFAAMTASEAWALFGEGNGAASLGQMLARICSLPPHTDRARRRSGYRLRVHPGRLLFPAG
jgi:putative restriction endonuclease